MHVEDYWEYRIKEQLLFEWDTGNEYGYLYDFKPYPEPISNELF